jgi:hypothetical protein
MIAIQPFNKDAFRARIRKFDDAKLIEYGKACHWTCPYPDRDESDRQARRNGAIQLRLCREEWRQRHPKPTQTSGTVSSKPSPPP